MSFTLRAALGFRSRVGPKTGLAVLRPLIDQLSGADRAHVILAALECARALRDEASYEDILVQWVGVEATSVFEALASEVGAARSFSRRLAQELAHAERLRSPEDARAHYLLARVSDGDLRAASYNKALLLAARPPASESYVAQIVASMIDAGLDPGNERVSALSERHIAKLSVPSQIAIDGYRLRSARGYKRVAVLDALLERVAGGPEASLALEVVAEFADRELPTALEWDRLSTLALAAGEEPKRRFDMWRALREGEASGSALAQEAKVALAPSSSTASDAATLDREADAWAWTQAERQAASAAYAEISKLRRGEPVDLAPFLANAELAGGPALALCALGLSASTSQRADFADFAQALVERSSARRGWLRLSQMCDDHDELKARLLERALSCGEKGAESALGTELRSRAWASSDPDDALALMSRARRLLRGA